MCYLYKIATKYQHQFIYKQQNIHRLFLSAIFKTLEEGRRILIRHNL